MTEKEMIKKEVQDVIVICINILADLKPHTNAKDFNIKMQKYLLEREKMSFCGNILKDINDIIQDIYHERINVKTAIASLESSYILVRNFYDVISEENIGDSKNIKIRGDICEGIVYNLKRYCRQESHIMLQLFLLIQYLKEIVSFEDEWKKSSEKFLENILENKIITDMQRGISIYELELKYFTLQ